MEEVESMALMGLLLEVGAGIAIIVFAFQILALGFRAGTGWGLASVLIPFGALVFVLNHWEETKRPFLRSLLALPVYLIGLALTTLAGGNGIAW